MRIPHRNPLNLTTARTTPIATQAHAPATGGRERNHGNERTRVWRPYRQLVGAGDAGLGVHQIERRREASGPESAHGPAASRHEPRGTGEAEEGPRL